MTGLGLNGDVTRGKSAFMDGTALGLSIGASGDNVERLQHYLRRFGYLFDITTSEDFQSPLLKPESVPPVPRQGFFDETTTKALKNFQKFAGLDQTGNLDVSTLEVINKSRCGNKDVKITRCGISSFVTGVGRWDRTNITYSFQNYSRDLPVTEQQTAIEQAFSLWATVTPLSFRRIADGISGDIVIRFVAGEHGDGNPFDGVGSTLAHAFFPFVTTALRGDTHFDEDENWTVNIPTGTGAFDLVTVAAHEFGHALGLNHSEVNSALMAPFYSGPRRFLSPDDILGIQSLYGNSPVPQAATSIHGNSAVIEIDEDVEFQRNFGAFHRVIGKPNTKNWVHFSLPTPLYQDGKPLAMHNLKLRMLLSENTVLREIQIRDGDRLVASFMFVNRSGLLNFDKFAIPSMPTVRECVHVSLGLDFGGGSSTDRQADLVSLGMEFVSV